MQLSREGAVQRKKDSRRDLLTPRSRNLGGTSMDSALPQVAAIVLRLRPACLCTGPSASNSGEVGVSPAAEMISSAPFRLGPARPPTHLLPLAWGHSGVRPARKSPCGQIRDSV